MATNAKRTILLIVLVALLLALYLPAQACCTVAEQEPPISATRSPVLYLPLVALDIVIVTPTPTPTPTSTATPMPTVTLFPTIHPTLTIVTPTRTP
jgi:hypothetical protein